MVYSYTIQLYLFIFRKDASIIYFKCDPFIGVNDLRRTISWKVKNAWKAEIENIGLVKMNDSVLFNNKQLKSSLKLIAYGRRGRRITMILLLNVERVSLHPIPEVTIESMPNPSVQQLKEDILRHNKDLTDIYYKYQNNHEYQKELELVNEIPENLSLPQISLIGEIQELEDDQYKYISERYHSTLKHYSHNQNQTSWTPEPLLITLSNAPKNSPE